MDGDNATNEMFDKGLALYNSHQYHDAIMLFNQIIELKPEHFFLGIIGDYPFLI